MFSDDDSSAAQRPFDEKLDRESGVFIEPDARDIEGDPSGRPSAPSQYVADDAPESGNPGTVDDLPLTFGIETQAPNDEHLVLDGATRPGGDSRDKSEAAEDLGKADEKELWSEQKALIEEDEKAGLKLEGFDEEQIPDVLSAMGDDAADALQDFPDGTSATGAWNTPEHGGFPERD